MGIYDTYSTCGVSAIHAFIDIRITTTGRGGDCRGTWPFRSRKKNPEKRNNKQTAKECELCAIPASSVYVSHNYCCIANTDYKPHNLHLFTHKVSYSYRAICTLHIIINNKCEPGCIRGWPCLSKFEPSKIRKQFAPHRV